MIQEPPSSLLKVRITSLWIPVGSFAHSYVTHNHTYNVVKTPVCGSDVNAEGFKYHNPALTDPFPLCVTGRLYQVEYAMEAIGHAGTCLGILANDGVLLAAERRNIHKLLDEVFFSEKIYKLNE